MSTLLMRVAAAALVVALGATACSTGEEPTTSATGGTEQERVTLRIPASTQSGGYPTPFAAIRGPGRLKTTYAFDTLAFPDVTGEPKP